MKTNRNYAIIALVLSAIVFTATAFADTLIGSGYENFKGAAKRTITTASSASGNYTIEHSIVVKIDGNIFEKEYGMEKVDSENKKRENQSTSFDRDRKSVV